MEKDKLKLNPKHWTYGLELEWADWDTRLGWAPFGRDPEPNILNSNGIAADPALKLYPFGGEINTLPTETPEGQLEQVKSFLKKHPHTTVNHRAGLHVHIRIPGLRNHLPTLKKLQQYITENANVYPHVNPLPLPLRIDYKDTEEYKAARKWILWTRMSEWSKTPINRVEQQLAAKTIQEFFEREVVKAKNGKILWHGTPRASISLRQLLQTDTIEFRHFLSTTDEERIYNSITWCRDYLIAFLNGTSAMTLFETKYKDKKFPAVPKFVYWREKRFWATTTQKNDRETVKRNIELILTGKFDDVKIDYPHLIP